MIFILAYYTSLGERRVRNAEVESSILFESTTHPEALQSLRLQGFFILTKTGIF